MDPSDAANALSVARRVSLSPFALEIIVNFDVDFVMPAVFGSRRLRRSRASMS